MSIWDAVGAAIDRTFRDREQILYSGAGLSAAPLWAIRSDVAAPDFQGSGRSLREISYEIEQADLLEEPRKSDTLIHRGRIWRVEDRTRRDDIGKWVVIVVDCGSAS